MARREHQRTNEREVACWVWAISKEAGVIQSLANRLRSAIIVRIAKRCLQVPHGSDERNRGAGFNVDIASKEWRRRRKKHALELDFETKETDMHTLDNAASAPRTSRDTAQQQSPAHSPTVALATSAEQTQRREATRKYVERVNQYFARDDVPRRPFSATVE